MIWRCCRESLNPISSSSSKRSPFSTLQRHSKRRPRSRFPAHEDVTHSDEDSDGMSDIQLDEASSVESLDAIPLVLKQRTKEWQKLRESRLTASTFASALGFYGNYRRSELWAQKLGLRKPFPGNTATDWGIRREAAAIRKYEEFTGVTVNYLAFQIYREGDKTKDWLGGSPDGLIGADRMYEENGGILEVKCPYNQGKPQFSIPWNGVPYHYIPQIQGLMEILDRDWLDLFVWTVNGSVIYRHERDSEYWELIFDILNDFWWGSVVPGKKALLAQKTIDVNAFKPVLRHKLTTTAVKESKILARKALMVKKFLV